MDVYGLTGGIGSGKSTVANLLESYGIPVVSADELSRIVVARGSDGLHEVVQRFGHDMLDEHGELDRRKLAAKVFSDPAHRRELEAILHPRIRDRFEQVLDALEKAGHKVAVYEVPLLFEKNLQSDMKAVILVTADDAVRIDRVCQRDTVTAADVRARMAAQMDEANKRRRADYIIENNGGLDDLRREIEFVLSRFLRVPAGSARLADDPDPDGDDKTPVRTGATVPVAPDPDPETRSLPASSPPLPEPAADDQASRLTPPPQPAFATPTAPAARPPPSLHQTSPSNRTAASGERDAADPDAPAVYGPPRELGSGPSAVAPPTVASVRAALDSADLERPFDGDSASDDPAQAQPQPRTSPQTRPEPAAIDSGDETARDPDRVSARSPNEKSSAS